MDRNARFFECLLPTTQCNLKCEYCYIIQENRRGMRQIGLDYSVEHILKALSVERVGGVCYFSLCGTGETFLQKELVPLIHGLLEEGHYVNITTNGTVTNRIEELLDFNCALLKHLHISFSLHYLELKRIGKLDAFFENVRKVRVSGASVLVQINLYDGYMPYFEEIRNRCLKEIGALPQVAATRREMDGDVFDNIQLHTDLTEQEYFEVGEQFDSPLFRFTMHNFNVTRKEFCYAGDWSFNLDLKTGNLKACYHSGISQNIFNDLSKPIRYQAVGNNCKSRYCINSSHFISMGVIPEYKCMTYAQLRNRQEVHWYTEEMRNFLNQKLYENHDQYSLAKKCYINLKMKIRDIARTLRGMVR
ncbi:MULTISPECIES: radical SAM protein [Clostridia]|jgi:organic radical activating enzyme|uniref:radical SAM protein n=1 Tax=Clostridia TaxID=186801 RepID=UPI0015FAF4A4|nr:MULTISPECIES: radical SAM protein [Clostridia]